MTQQKTDMVDGHAPPKNPFWREKTLTEMTEPEWESLCDGCARCCLNKLEDADTGAIEWTNVACRMLDEAACRCRDYQGRQKNVPDCVPLTPQTVRALTWLPPTCAYRLVAEGRGLYWWHYLVSGDRETVHQAGISIRGRTVSENDVPAENLDDFIASWPGERTGEPSGEASFDEEAEPTG